MTTPPKAAPEPSAQEELREAFLKVECTSNLTQYKNGDYQNPCVQSAWEGWQAGAQWQATRQAAPIDLHAAVMNIHCKPDYGWPKGEQHAFKLGHKSARHAAAELVADAAPVSVSRPPIDTRKFRELTMAYAKAIMHGSVPESSQAWGALVLHVEQWGEDASPVQTAVAVPQWVVDGVNSAWDCADTPEAMSVHYKVEVSLDLFREIRKIIIAAHQPEQKP